MTNCTFSVTVDDDVDGIPISSPRPPATGTGPGFVPPKWESVSPQRVEAQVGGMAILCSVIVATVDSG